MNQDPFIEIHCHFFNGHYTPMAEILDHKFRLPRPLAIAFAQLLKPLVGRKTFPLADEEVELTEVIHRGRREKDMAAIIANAIAEQLQAKRILGLFSANLVDSDSRDLLESAVEFLAAYSEAEEEETIPKAKLELGLTEFMSLGSTDEEEKISLRGFFDFFTQLREKILRLLLNVPGAMDFLLIMLMDDQVLCNMLLEDNYPPDDKPLLTTHLTMDIEPAYWVRNQGRENTVPATYDFTDKQIDLSSEFIARSEGRLLGFVAFHPERGREQIDECWKALKKGHVGIKLYPPLNYHPLGKDVGQDTRDYQDIMRELYQRCTSLDIPITTHCTPSGFQTWSGTGPLSNPLYWEEVLKEHEDLRLNFGHAGGGVYEYNDYYLPLDSPELKTAGWVASPEHWERDRYSYAKHVARLCRHYKNAYMDFSYLFIINFVDQRRENFVQNLRREMAAPGAYSLADKIMYGTDWHMPIMLDRVKDHLGTMRGIFSEHFSEAADRFFFINAVRFLNLEAFLDRERALGDESVLGTTGIEHLTNVWHLAGSPPQLA